MATIWNSTNKAETKKKTVTGRMLSSLTRQQELAMIACLVILAIVLIISACSKQSSGPATAGVSSSAASAMSAPATQIAAANAEAAPAAKVKKAQKKRPANVTYSDPNSGVSFVYPRKFTLSSGDETQPGGMDKLAMNFVEPGGVAIATVELPKTLYPGTDFASGFFRVNVNRSLSEEECPHFAFVDSNDADGEPIDAEKVKVGMSDEAKEMEMTSEFEGSATRQMETQYYHNYENGACYEYVLGLGTAGFGMKEGVKPVDRDEVFARLEKILATVKTQPAHDEAAAQQEGSPEDKQEQVVPEKASHDGRADDAVAASPER